MMTQDELYRAEICQAVAHEAHAQAEKRLADALATKESHERKAFEMLRAFVTVSVAAFAASGAAMMAGTQTAAAQIGTALGLPFFLVGIVWTLGACLAMAALFKQDYGAAGSDPSLWIVPGVIDGDSSTVPTMLAYLTVLHEKRIRDSVASNRFKANCIGGCVFIGGTSPVLLAVSIFLVGL